MLYRYEKNKDLKNMCVISYSGPVNIFKMRVMLSEKGEIRKITV